MSLADKLDDLKIKPRTRRTINITDDIWYRFLECCLQATGSKRKNSEVVDRLLELFTNECETEMQAAKDLAAPDTDTEDDAHKRG